ncbi:hypothetical protein GCM10010987_45650 [Bradyrhizobium guangdongense]|uniref:Uncharacterized protein n=1 Tax=Bradyrhizobium guangdongense TaxID=1325090 RepID=A0AA87W688_9BRAD|nr:hypothetical protein GCM10010987_45650 [Bradyrhizobium guangdongense]
MRPIALSYILAKKPNRFGHGRAAGYRPKCGTADLALSLDGSVSKRQHNAYAPIGIPIVKTESNFGWSCEAYDTIFAELTQSAAGF